MYFWHNTDIYLDVFGNMISLLFSIYWKSTFIEPILVVMVTTATLHYFIKGGINSKPLNNLGHTSITSTDKMLFI